MSVSKTLFGATVNIPVRPEKGWGNEVTNILTQLIDSANQTQNLVSGVAYLLLTNTTSVVTAGSSLTTTHCVHKLSAASAVTLSTSTAIVDGVAGQLLVLLGTSDANTVTIKEAANTALNGTCVLKNYSAIVLIFDGTVWVELFRKE